MKSTHLHYTVCSVDVKMKNLQERLRTPCCPFSPLELKCPFKFKVYLTIDIHILPAMLSQGSLGNPTHPGNGSLRTSLLSAESQNRGGRMDYISHNAKQPESRQPSLNSQTPLRRPLRVRRVP